MIKYNEQTTQVTTTTFEVFKQVNLSLPIRGAKPVIAAETVKATQSTESQPRIGTGRVFARELNAQLANVSFPILDDDGNPTGDTMTVGALFKAAESAAIRLAQVEDT